MTLFKQVALVVSMVFLLLAIVTTIADYRRSGVFVETQLQSVAQDIATSLGVTVSNSIEGEDTAALETLFNAVFDSGYYSRIELVATDGRLIHKKQQYLQREGVPQWFIALVPLEPATGTTQVMQGWLPLGQLSVTLHPGLSYMVMYENLQVTLFWFAALLVLGLAVLWYLLHVILKPLANVKYQADAIHDNQFVQQTELPKTQELRSVVTAMNEMVAKVKLIFDDQERTLVRYQELLYIDSLTGLGNRKYILTRLERLRAEDASYHGCFVVLKIQGLKAYQDKHGYEKSELIIKQFADLLLEQFNNDDGPMPAHLSNDEFALLLTDDAESVREKVETLFQQYKSLSDIKRLEDELSLNAGITSIHTGREIGDIFAEVDFSLTQAQAAGPYNIQQMITTDLVLPQGKMQWRSWLEQAIIRHQLYLVAQRVVDLDGADLHQEVYVRLKDDNEQTIPAGIFMPMAMSLGFGFEIDRAVFERLKNIGSSQGDTPLALNLSSSFFEHTEAYETFDQLMHSLKQQSLGICAEVSHSIANRYPVICNQLAERVRAMGNSFGIDNLDLANSLQILQSIRPDYVKIHASTLQDIATGEMPAGYQALRTLIDTLGIRLIAVAVDSQQLLDHLKRLGVDGMQGNLISETRELE